MKLLPLSKSRFGVFSTCKYYCHMVYERNIRPPGSKSGSVGVLLHKLKKDVQTNQTNLDDALGVIKDKEDKDALLFAIASDALFDQASEIKWEWDLRLNAKGQPVRSRGILRGILDRALWIPPHFIVQDIKFGNWWVDDVFERRSYVLLTLPHIPPTQDVEFQRVWPKLDKVDNFLYQRTGSLFRVIEDGVPLDLWDYLQQCVLAIASAEPTPTPGPHCENWYGAPCYFLNNFCPITKELPVVVTPEISVIKSDVHRMLNTSDIASLPQELVSSVYGGVLQLQGVIAVLTEKVKEWCETNGDIIIGSKIYGWRDHAQRVVDTKFILDLLLENSVPTDDIARAVNISHTSLGRLPRRYNDVKKIAMELGIYEGEPTKQFGGRKCTT